MCDSRKGKSGGKTDAVRASAPLPSSIYDNEIPIGSPVSKSAETLARIRFLPRELPDGVSSPSAMSPETMETHVLDVESPGATLQRKVNVTWMCMPYMCLLCGLGSASFVDISEEKEEKLS